ncbi:MAG: nucleotidyltransferase domain-containing protein [Myxococcaceae bacterium]
MNNTVESQLGLSLKDLAMIQEALRQFPEIDSAKVYGSRAKGTYKPGSDIDLALYGSGVSLDTVFKLDTVLDDLLLPYQFDLSVYSGLKNLDLKEHIDRVGIRIL